MIIKNEYQKSTWTFILPWLKLSKNCHNRILNCLNKCNICPSVYLLYGRGSQPPGPVPLPGLEEGPSGTRKVSKVVNFTQL